MTAIYRVKTHLLLLAGFSTALFLPMIGCGFVRDDFVLLITAASNPIWHGLTHAHGAFYTPLTWIWFKADWYLWGMNAFPFALGNLVIHVANSVLLYYLALKLYRNETAAWWTAFGFALLFPANTWAVMWIATRAHILVAFFYLAALNATLSFTRARRRRFLPGCCVFLLSALAMFSKEDGVTVIVAIVIIIFYEKQLTRTSSYLLFVSFLPLVAAYFWLRAPSGAEAINFDITRNYGYHPSVGVLFENLGLAILRTYGCLGLIATGIAFSLYFQIRQLELPSVSKRDPLLSVALFLIALGPFLLLRVRLGIYMYLAGASAALLLGATVRGLISSTPKTNERPSLVATIPLVLVVLMLVATTVRHSWRWMRMAETSTAILSQMKAQQPTVYPIATIVLRYAKVDEVHRFPDNFGSWTFPSAVQLLYANPKLNGVIVKESEAGAITGDRPTIYFTYVADAKSPTIRRTSGSDPASNSLRKDPRFQELVAVEAPKSGQK